ncbi:hypothetical protein VNI00_001345 [Paramarasmius palmivorus]|uniref:Membrane insertase YidC/Oxa/ALB C-terminal domain-containing protein n=1 Tax=Paramarasmius palmivorus TaxID=297713 RepID=A0AAW0EBJ6_9AGAR
MLLRASLQRPLRIAGHRHLPLRRDLPLGRRTFIQGLCNGFLDLAVALPYPPEIPAYSATIILVTVAARLACLPVALWGSSRARRMEENVLPVLRKEKPIVAQQEFEAMQRERITGDKEYLKKVHSQRCEAIMKARRKELWKIHNCNPLVTMAVPPLSQMPPFVILTVVFARLSMDPFSGFDAESFFTLTTLNHADPTMTMPVILGLLTMANVEANSWVLTASEKRMQKEIQEKKEQAAQEKGVRHIEPQKIVKSIMRALSVGRIGLGAIAPGAVCLYWVTSAAFGLVQTWILNYIDAQRKRRLYGSMLNSPHMQEPQAIKVAPAPSKTKMKNVAGSASALQAFSNARDQRSTTDNANKKR